MQLRFATLAAMVAGAFGGAVELGPDNFDSAISGKGAFVKFLAPWCGHCKKMKPAWDQLGDEFAGSETVLIGDVDCTVDANKALCSKYGVRGYPTIKYFTDSTAADGDKYEGGRDFAALKSFADENLGPSCSYANIELCDDADTAYLTEWHGKGKEAVDAEVSTRSKAVDDSMKGVDELLKSLKKQFEDAQKAHEALSSEHSRPLKLLRSISFDGGNDEL